MCRALAVLMGLRLTFSLPQSPRELLSAETAVKREAKSKGEKESYSHLNAEFQRKARRDKKAFLSDQCKEIEENNNGKD